MSKQLEKFCQSCGMHLEHGNLGTEVDGIPSPEYCNLCLRDGEYTDPYITMEEIIERGKRGLDRSDIGGLKKFLLKVTYPYLVKNLHRWKK